MSHAAACTPTVPPSDARPGAAHDAQRWAVGVLAVATVLLLAYLALLVAVALALRLGGGTPSPGRSAGRPSTSSAILADVAPSLLVGWCTGLAASAVLAGGEALGARTAGLAAGGGRHHGGRGGPGPHRPPLTDLIADHPPEGAETATSRWVIRNKSRQTRVIWGA